MANTSHFQNEILATGFDLPTNIEFLPDGRMLVTRMRSAFSGIGPEADLEQLRAAEKHKIRAYDLSTHTLLGSDDGNLPCVSAFSFHPSGEMLAVGLVLL